MLFDIEATVAFRVEAATPEEAERLARLGLVGRVTALRIGDPKSELEDFYESSARLIAE
jgi:hypothetical protein